MKQFNAAMLFLVSLAAAAEPIEHQITVKGAATVRVPPDFVVVELAIASEGADVAQLKQDADDKAAKLLAAAARFQVAAKDIKSGGMQLERVYETDRNDNDVFKGYAVSRDMQITLRKIVDYELLAQALVDAGAEVVDSVQVGVDDESKLKNPALAAAARNAKTKALAVSDALEIRIGLPIEVGEDRLWYDKNLVQIANQRGLDSIVVTGSRVTGRSPLLFTPHDIEVEATVWVRFSISESPAKL